MKDDPSITVLMPVYNAERFLEESISSIINQKFRDFELLIINDGSMDSSVNIIQKFKDNRIRLVNNQENIGLVKSLNKGLRYANGKYIARMDADDISHVERLSKQWEFMEKNPDVGICGTWVKTFGDEKIGIWRYPTTDAEIRCRLLFSSMFAHPSVMLRKSLLEKHGLNYSADLIYAEDYDLWTRCMDRFRLVNIPEPLLNYRLHKGNTRIQHGKEQRLTVKKIYSNLLKRIGIKGSEAEIDLHYEIGTYQLTSNMQTLDNVENWLNYLKDANQRSGYYFPDLEFRNALSLYWLNSCRSMKALGPSVAKRFSRSNLSKNILSRTVNRIKLEINTRLQ